MMRIPLANALAAFAQARAPGVYSAEAVEVLKRVGRGAPGPLPAKPEWDERTPEQIKQWNQPGTPYDSSDDIAKSLKAVHAAPEQPDTATPSAGTAPSAAASASALARAGAMPPPPPKSMPKTTPAAPAVEPAVPTSLPPSSLGFGVAVHASSDFGAFVLRTCHRLCGSALTAAAAVTNRANFPGSVPTLVTPALLATGHPSARCLVTWSAVGVRCLVLVTRTGVVMVPQHSEHSITFVATKWPAAAPSGQEAPQACLTLFDAILVNDVVQGHATKRMLAFDAVAIKVESGVEECMHCVVSGLMMPTTTCRTPTTGRQGHQVSMVTTAVDS